MPKLREMEYAADVAQIKADDDELYDVTSEELAESGVTWAIPSPANPSAADLDSIADEQRIAEETA